MTTSTELLNILIHIGAGIAAMAIGFYQLFKPKQGARHRALGRVYVLFTLVVCASAAAGLVLYRFLPLFAILTVLATYQLLSGWHVIYTKARGPGRVDAGLLLGGAIAGVWLAGRLLRPGVMPGVDRSVMISTLAALGLLLAYDAARWLFPRRWHATLWLYEHVYKIVATLFGMLSAAVGNTVRVWQPWSQLLPTVLGMLVILWCWRRIPSIARPAIPLDSQASQSDEEARCASNPPSPRSC